MALIAFLGLLFVVWMDILCLRKLDKDGFESSFQGFPRMVFPAVVVCAVVAVFSENPVNMLNFFTAAFILPFYLIRRENFKLKDPLFRSPVETLEGQNRLPFVLLSDAFGIVMVWFFCVVVVSLIVQSFSEVFPFVDSELDELVFSTIFSSITVTVLIYFASRKFPGKDFWEKIRMDWGRRPLWQTVFSPIMAGLFFASISAWLIVERHIQPETPLSDVLRSATSPVSMIFFIIVAIFIAPLVEELVFRGYFFYVFRKSLGFVFALISISLVFALLHVQQYWGDWTAIAMVTFLGFALTLMRAWTGTAAASAVMHYAYNGGVTVITLVLLILSNPFYFQYQAYYDYLDIPEQEKLLLKAIEKDPHLYEAYNDLAWLYATEGENLEEGLELIQKALEADPENLLYVDTKKELLYQMGEESQAQALEDHLREQGFGLK